MISGGKTDRVPRGRFEAVEGVRGRREEGRMGGEGDWRLFLGRRVCRNCRRRERFVLIIVGMQTDEGRRCSARHGILCCRDWLWPGLSVSEWRRRGGTRWGSRPLAGLAGLETHRAVCGPGCSGSEPHLLDKPWRTRVKTSLGSQKSFV